MVTRPDVATSLIGGHLSRTNRANLRPSIDPGIWMSVKTILNIGSGFEDGDRLVGVAGFDHLEARVSDHLRAAAPEQRLVFHDENDRPPDC